LIVYNRSEEGITRFKTYAEEEDVAEGAYRVVKDLREIGRT
jgi:hypothetical protein